MRPSTTENTTTGSSSTGHSRPSERNFAKKLFIGLIVLVLVAFAIAFSVGQKRELRPAGVESAPVNNNSNTNPMTSPEAPQNQKTDLNN